MIDSEVARLRRLRGEALLVREIARMFQSAPWARNDSVLEGSGRIGWRIARAVSGRLRAHPYAEYQKDAGWAIRAANRMQAWCLRLANNDRVDGLKVIAAYVSALGRRLDDAIALAWSSEFSEALMRAQVELKALAAALARETETAGVQARPVPRPAFTQHVGSDLGTALEADWPYLAL